MQVVKGTSTPVATAAVLGSLALNGSVDSVIQQWGVLATTEVRGGAAGGLGVSAGAAGGLGMLASVAAQGPPLVAAHTTALQMITFNLGTANYTYKICASSRACAPAHGALTAPAAWWCSAAFWSCWLCAHPAAAAPAALDAAVDATERQATIYTCTGLVLSWDAEGLKVRPWVVVGLPASTQRARPGSLSSTPLWLACCR